MDGAISTADEPKRASNKVTLAVLVFVLAVALFGAAFYYAGGMELVQPLIGGLVSPSGTGAPAASTPASAPVSPPTATFDPALGKRMYVEQIESQSSLQRLAAGEIKGITVDRVDAGSDVAIVSITARFTDGTKAAGAMKLVKRDGLWFFFALTGMRSGATGGLADSVNKAAQMESSQTIENEFKRAGIVEPDAGVIKTLFEQQSANQEMFEDLLAGTYTAYELGKPTIGAGTVSIPVKILEKSGAASTGRIVLIKKTVEGKDRVFLTKFAK
jgi:hypothetical protein